MKNQNTTPEEIAKDFIVESVDCLTSDYEIYDVIRSLQKAKYEFIKGPETEEANKLETIRHLFGIENLLIDIAEANAKYNLMILNKYEQLPD